MIVRQLNEDVLDDIANEPEVVSSDAAKSEIEDALDECLDASLTVGDLGNWQNLLIIGEAGIGKTAIVKKWAEDNNINLVSVKASTMDETDLGGAIAPDNETGIVKRYASVELDALDKIPNSVLFLDEFNRARNNVRGTLLTLIQDHVVADPRERTGERVLKNFLFTVACINPADTNYNTNALDSAELGRFRILEIKGGGNKRIWLNWIKGYLDNLITRNSNSPERVAKLNARKELITTLVSAKEFQFDTTTSIDKSKEKGNGLALSPRNLTNLLLGCNGKKDDFLGKWNQYCNSLDKETAVRILNNYQDKDDKANDALNVERNPDGSVRGRSKRMARMAAAAAEDEEKNGSTFGAATDAYSKILANNPDLFSELN